MSQSRQKPQPATHAHVIRDPARLAKLLEDDENE
jgi:hypothetical protein